VATTLDRQRPSYSALDLPRPGKAALIFSALAVVALALDVDPSLPWQAGVVAAGFFAAAGTVRTVREHRELAAVRQAADRLIVHAPRSRDASELVRWRSDELTTRSARDGLLREVDRLRRSLDPARLPSASPVRRPAARASDDLLEELAVRLGDARPISARGILLAQAFLRDPESPLYSEANALLLPRTLRRILGALEP
jgi:hypothetical protein